MRSNLPVFSRLIPIRMIQLDFSTSVHKVFWKLWPNYREHIYCCSSIQILNVVRTNRASERKRRQVYRGEVHGQLPFDTKGMDNPVPTVDFSPSGSMDSAYSLERDDVEGYISKLTWLGACADGVVDASGLLRVLDDLEQFAQSSNDHVAIGAVQESRGALEKLVNKMDSLETGFDRIAERSCNSVI